MLGTDLHKAHQVGNCRRKGSETSQCNSDVASSGPADHRSDKRDGKTDDSNNDDYADECHEKANWAATRSGSSCSVASSWWATHPWHVERFSKRQKEGPYTGSLEGIAKA